MAAAALSLLAASGCRFFRPAEPEPPTSGSLFVPDYTDPFKTLSTMRQAIEARNQQGPYKEALADSAQGEQPFNATFDPADIAELPQGTNIPSRWTRDNEAGFYTYLTTLRGDAIYFLSFQTIPGQADSVGVDRYLLHRAYTYYLLNGDTLARGQADLRFIRGNTQQWRLLHWVDHRDPSARPEHHTFGWERLKSQ
jgi:hypothetical protein